MFKTHPVRLSILMRKFGTFLCHPPLQRGIVGVLCILPLMLPNSVQAQKPQGKGKQGSGAGSSKAIISAGKTLFVKNCSICHGASGQGSEGPSLQKLTMSDAAIGTTIKNGIKGEMPAFGTKFKDTEIKALTAFIHSIKK
jgi:mono/diheme cytochrome c family protein